MAKRKFKNLLIYTLTFALLFCSTVIANAQNTKPDKIENSTEYLPPIYYFFANAGYGEHDLWGAVGFRYWMFGVSFGLAGFNKGLPSYRSDRILNENEIGAVEYYTKLVIHGEASVYWDLTPNVSLFASAGYYSKSDSILARPYDITDPYLYRYKARTQGGLCFGIGGQYFFQSQIGVGVGYHTENGFYLQVGYYWE
jgi:hypothetical protein